ncbi:unnamed protein product [Durusdinium trenchii]|uniref:Protein kinase domain-containing protein n=1 Tax=Durusdinium trenchii TaxID=1381693 RepID=A0ABP0LSP8_9DINO
MGQCHVVPCYSLMESSYDVNYLIRGHDGDHAGAGAFGEVRRCTHRASHASRCVKTIPKKDCWTRGYVLEEIELLEMVSGKHPNIVRFFEFFEEWDCLHLIFEFCPRGSLDQVIHSSSFQAGGDELVAKLVCQVASALDFLKELAIVHRDVKPGNLLFEEDQVKLADFGCACLAPEPLEEPMGTPIFWAPEVHQLPRGKGYHFPVDMWALGICFYMMLYQGVHPFLQKGFLSGEISDVWACSVQIFVLAWQCRQFIGVFFCCKRRRIVLSGSTWIHHGFTPYCERTRHRQFFDLHTGRGLQP